MKVRIAIDPSQKFFGPQIPNWLLKKKEFGFVPKVVYGQLRQYWIQYGGKCFPSIAKLSEDLGISERQVSEHLATLKKFDLIGCERRGFAISNRYFLWDHPWMHESDIQVNCDDDGTPAGNNTSSLMESSCQCCGVPHVSDEDSRILTKGIEQKYLNKSTSPSGKCQNDDQTSLNGTSQTVQPTSPQNDSNRLPPSSAPPPAATPSKMPQDDLTLVSDPVNGKSGRAPAGRKAAKPAKEPADPRYVEFTAVWFTAHTARGDEYVFSGRDGAGLKDFLKLNPTLTSKEFETVVKRAFTRKNQLSNFLQDRILTLHGFLGEYQTIKVRSAASPTGRAEGAGSRVDLEGSYFKFNT